MDALEASEPVVASQDERTNATLAHALQPVGWWIAPLVIFAVNRRSRFVSFHALQALLWQCFFLLVLGVLVMGWMGFVFFMILNSSHGQPLKPPMALFILVPFVWGGFFLVHGATLALAIIYAIKAGRGEWADYPVFGRLARRILKF